MPPKPSSDRTILRNPTTGTSITLERWPTFGLTVIFGCFYLAYREAWVHAAIALVLALFTYGLSWLIYPFFAYGIIVDSYRRKGWIVETVEAAPHTVDFGDLAAEERARLEKLRSDIASRYG